MMLGRVTWEDINMLPHVWLSLYVCIYVGVGVGRCQESRKQPGRGKEKGFKGARREGNRPRDLEGGKGSTGTKGREWGYRDGEWREESTKPNKNVGKAVSKCVIFHANLKQQPNKDGGGAEERAQCQCPQKQYKKPDTVAHVTPAGASQLGEGVAAEVREA